MKTRKAFRIAAQILLIGLLVGADQLLKHWAERVLGGGRVLQADGFMALRYVRNTGAAFSMLSGKTVVLVANLKPIKLCGIESHGMILCASDDADSKLSALTTLSEMESGLKVR